MFADKQATEMFGADAKAVFEFWASFWPTAPMFGVEWRFAQFAPTLEPMMQAFWPFPPEDEAYGGGLTVEGTAVEVAPAAEAEAEVVEAEPDPDPEPEAPTPTAAPASLLASAPAEVDDLTRIRGVGPAMALQLNRLGVYTFAQLAGFSEADLLWLDDNLTGLKGACLRGDWVGQSKTFAA